MLIIFGTIKYIFNCGSCRSCNDTFFSKIYHRFFSRRFLSANLLIFKVDQQNLSFCLSNTRRYGGATGNTSNFIPEIHPSYKKRRFPTSKKGSSSSERKATTSDHDRLSSIITQLSSKKKSIQRFIKTRKHLSFNEEFSSRKSVVRTFSKIRKRSLEKKKEHDLLSVPYTGIRARSIIRYRFKYGYRPQDFTPAQIRMMKERTRQWKRKLGDVYIRETKRISASLEKEQDVERVYGVVEKILFKPDLFNDLSISEIRRFVGYFRKKNPSYAIVILEAARDYESGLDQRDYSMMLELYGILEDHHIGAMHTMDVLKSQGFNPSLEDYLNLLRVMIIKGVSLRRILSYVEEMKLKRYQLDYYVNSLLIDKLIELKNMPLAGELLMNMMMKRQTTHGLILPKIFRIQQEGEESSGDLSLYVTIYSTLIQTFINHDHYYKAVEFYWKLLDKYSPDIQIVELMIYTCLAINDIKTAQELLLYTQTPRISRVFFHTMDHCIKNKNLKCLFKLYNTSRDKGVTFTEREYHNLIYSLCLKDCATDAFIIYKDARSKGFLTDNLFIFNKLMKVMIKYERIKEVELIRKDMENLGMKPDIETFRNFMQLATIHHDLEKAEMIFREVYQIGLPIDYTTLSCLLKCFADSGNLDKAKSMLKMMHQSDFKPTIYDYNNLIRAAGALTNYQVKNIGILISNIQLSPNIDTYNCFLESYLRSNFLPVAKKVYKSVVKDGFEFNLETFHIFFKHICRIRDYESAFGFYYYQLEYNGLEPSVYTYNLLMQNAYESKNPEIIAKIYHELYDKGVKLNDTPLYVKLITFWGDKKEYRKVEDIVDHIRIGRIGEEILVESIAEFINVYVNHKHYDKAENLWKLVQHEKLTVNENLYHSMTELYTSTKENGKLHNIYKLMINKGI